jgi:hypothetical protein
MSELTEVDLGLKILGYLYSAGRKPLNQNTPKDSPAKKDKLEIFFEDRPSRIFHGEEAVAMKAAMDKLA